MRRLTIAVQNCKHGALRTSEGQPDDRWPLIVDRIRSAPDRVDAVMLTEVVDWHRYGHAQLARACADLDMDAAPLAPSSSGYGTGLLYRRETMGRWLRHNDDFAHKTLHGFAVTTFDVGLPQPLALVPCHLTPFSAEAAVVEAGYLARRALKYGQYAIIAGDLNYPPADPAHPAPAFRPDRPFDRATRTLADLGLPPEQRPPYRQVTQKLVHHGFVDVAWHLYQQTGDSALLRATGTDDRIDQGWVSNPLASAIRSYRVLDTPPGASDHAGLLFQLDLAA